MTCKETYACAHTCAGSLNGKIIAMTKKGSTVPLHRFGIAMCEYAFNEVYVRKTKGCNPLDEIGLHVRHMMQALQVCCMVLKDFMQTILTV